MGSKRILVVEDEAVTAMDLKSNLVRLGYEVPAVVSRGEDAIRAAAEVAPDLVLMDITLDGPMSGIEAAAEIRKSHGIPVVFLTAHADPETLGRAKLTEPFGYLPKPCGTDALTSAIEVALYKAVADARRRKAEAELFRVQEEQRIVLDNLGVGVLYLKNRTIVRANPALLKMFGYSREEAEGRGTEMFYTDRESYEDFGRDGYAALALGEIHVGEVTMKRKDGSLIWCHLVGRAVDPGDAAKGSIWLLEDQTERRKLEQALVASEEKYRTVANFTHDWEFWIGVDGRMLYSSPACERITGYARQALDRDPTLFRRMVHPDDRPVFDSHRHEAQSLGEAGDLEFRIVRPDGLTRWIAHTCQPVRDGEGRFAGTRGSNRDITKRKAAEQERERLVVELQEALARVKLLSGIIPICASCKKIRDDRGYWQQVEAYIGTHSEAEFTHGICPDCAKRIYGEYYHEPE